VVKFGIATIFVMAPAVFEAGTLPQYTPAEAGKHIGEIATVVGKVGCIDPKPGGRCLTLDGCASNSPFWIIVPNVAPGPKLNVDQLKGVTVAVTGKIDPPQAETRPSVIVRTTWQIVARTPPGRGDTPVTGANQLPTPAAAKSEQDQAGSPDQRQFEAAKQEYEQSSQDEAARLRYANKLAKIIERNVVERWKTGEPNADYLKIVDRVHLELRSHPMPPTSDAKKLSQLLIGRWQSPRRIYVFRANGKWGSEDGSVTNNWRIQGNQLIQDGSRGTIILLNAEYFIYAEKDPVFFHSRVKD
jgi:hypothetical protein